MNGAEALDGPETQTGAGDTTGTENVSDEPVQDQDDGTDNDEQRGAGPRVAREAAKWRSKFRAAETTIAGQTATIERLQRLHVDAAITTAGMKPAAVHAITALTELLGDDGLPDAEKVAAAVGQARDRLGIPKPDPLREYRLSGLRSGAGEAPPRRDNWTAAFTPGDR